MHTRRSCQRNTHGSAHSTVSGTGSRRRFRMRASSVRRASPLGSASSRATSSINSSSRHWRVVRAPPPRWWRMQKHGYLHPVLIAWLACAIGNERAARFYEKCGWHRTGVVTSRLDAPSGNFSAASLALRKTPAPGCATGLTRYENLHAMRQSPNAGNCPVMRTPFAMPQRMPMRCRRCSAVGRR